jgi:A/G-specific adenine glycosylase
MIFSEQIISWYEQNKRALPWRGIKNPYHIWLSEIILQQTRVEQGLPYYEKFVKHYPTVAHLAQADEQEVLKLWQGLGYYSRARNLHYAAKQVVNDHQGDFPNDYKNILSLKGVGEYTAAAIASFAFDLPHAVVDGNVFRLLSRYFGIDTPINSTAGKKEFFALANELIDNNNPSTYNQGIMEFGSQQCKPTNPNCLNCPLQEGCVAHQKNRITELPLKLKTIKQKKLYFDYFFFKRKGHTYLKKREGKGIWQNLYDFPLIENESRTNKESILKEAEQWINGNNLEIISVSTHYKHILSHRIIYARFWEIEVGQEPSLISAKKIKLEDLHTLPVPRLIEVFLQEKELILSS